VERGFIEQQLRDARDGFGSVVVLEGPAGNGKSRLLHLAADLAREEGVQVLGASGSELERHFPFGVAIQLFEPWWLGADDRERSATLGGAAGPAATLLQQGPGSAEADAGYATVHGLFRLTAGLATSRRAAQERTPLVLLVDDAQWADGPSLRFVAYLAERLADLPIALIVAMRPGEPGADAEGLGALRVAAGDRLLRLRSLSPPAVKELVRAEFPDAADAFCAACGRISGGNPFLLLELLQQVRVDSLEPDRATASRLSDLAPDAILDATVARLGAMPPAVRSVALAVAVLGDGATLRHAAALTGLAPTETAEAADALAQMHLLCPGEPLSFVHPLIRRAVERSISPLVGGHEHARAAEILAQDNQPEEVIAPHLLAAPAQGDPRAVAILRAAARKALASGAVSSAVGLLRRALEEGAREDHSDLLAELAQAEVRAGLPAAADRLSEAIEACEDPRQRAELSLTLGAAHYGNGDYGDAVTVLAGAMLDTRHDDAELAEEIAATHFSAVTLVPALTAETERRGARLLASLRSAPRWPTWPPTRPSRASPGPSCAGWPSCRGETASSWRPTACCDRAGRWWPERCRWSTTWSAASSSATPRWPTRAPATRPRRWPSPTTAGRGRCISGGRFPRPRRRRGPRSTSCRRATSAICPPRTPPSPAATSNRGASPRPRAR